MAAPLPYSAPELSADYQAGSNRRRQIVLVALATRGATTLHAAPGPQAARAAVLAGGWVFQPDPLGAGDVYALRLPAGRAAKGAWQRLRFNRANHRASTSGKNRYALSRTH